MYKNKLTSSNYMWDRRQPNCPPVILSAEEVMSLAVRLANKGCYSSFQYDGTEDNPMWSITISTEDDNESTIEYNFQGCDKEEFDLYDPSKVTVVCTLKEFEYAIS